MKIKAFYRDTSSWLIFCLWFVIYAFIIIGTLWLFSRPIHRIEIFNHKLQEAETHLAQLTSLHATFLLGYDQVELLYTDESRSVQESARFCITNMEHLLSGFSRIGYLKTNHKASLAYKDFNKTLDAFNRQFNDLILTTLEKGNVRTGMVSRWLALSDNMLTVSDLHGSDIRIILTQVKQYEAQYLLQKETRILAKIVDLCEQVRSLIMPVEGGINLNDLDSYLTLCSQFMSIDKRIGDDQIQGIKAGFSKLMKDLPLKFEYARKAAEDAGQKSRRRWALARTITLFLLIGALLRMSALTLKTYAFNPLDSLKKLTFSLAKGELPEKSISEVALLEVIPVIKNVHAYIRNLQQKVAFTRALNERPSEAELQLDSEHQDVLGNELLQLQQKMRQTADIQKQNDEDNLRRRFVNEGLAKFGDILRTRSDDMQALGDAFIREVVKYLNAIQGGFFIYEERPFEPPVLTLVSAFAYNRKKYFQKSIEYGEGLVGTCAREKLTINLTEIPQGYISITSGLGDTLPENLLIVPVLHENDVIGVFEIASMHTFKTHEISFAEEVARNLGSTIIYTRNNQRTAELLAKSQQQALEMAEQEEEMRQNMEELKATQEESARREDDLKSIVNAVENVMFVIEYDLEGVIRKVNQKVCHFLGITKEEILGKTHYEVFAGSLQPDRQFWNDLQNKSVYTGIDNIHIGQKTYPIYVYFAAVQNRDGIVLHYINFATDVRIGNS
jgi:PAS domain S-box-containing protein